MKEKFMELMIIGTALEDNIDGFDMNDHIDVEKAISIIDEQLITDENTEQYARDRFNQLASELGILKEGE